MLADPALNPSRLSRVIGMVAFWLLLPGIIAAGVAVGVLVNRAFHPSLQGPFEEEIVVWCATGMVLVLIISLTVQALLIVRRPQTLTARQVPLDVAVLQFVLYAVVALWVALLAQTSIGWLSVIFGLAVPGLSIALLVCILRWRVAPSPRVIDVHLPIVLRLILWAYVLSALVGLMFAVASSFTPALDPNGNVAFIVLFFLGLPLSLLVFPILVIGLLAGYTIAYLILTAVMVMANMAGMLILLWNRSRAWLVNWFFKLGREPVAL